MSAHLGVGVESSLHYMVQDTSIKSPMWSKVTLYGMVKELSPEAGYQDVDPPAS